MHTKTKWNAWGWFHFLTTTFSLLGVTVSGQPSSQPNIVFVLADDYGFNDIGYHNSEMRTPNLDRLAREGVRLENYYVQPMCTPTRIQLMSGRYQIRSGMQHLVFESPQPTGLPLNSPTIADKLKEAGYSTNMVGKWHLGFYKKEYLPNYRGFDTFYGFLGGSESHYKHTSCARDSYGCGLDLWDNLMPDFSQRGTYSTHLFTQKAVDVIKAHKKTKPLFLYLSYQAVHSPVEVPHEYTKAYKFKDKQRRTYAGMTTCMDEGVGSVTRALQDAGLWNNTVFIFSSDNGGELFRGASNWPLRGSKGSFLEGGVRTIGFVHSPLLKKTGYINKQFIHVSDWFPTLVALAKGSLNGTLPLDGFNQWSTISENSTSPRTELLINIDPWFPQRGPPLHTDVFDTRIRAGIRVGDYKLITGNGDSLLSKRAEGGKQKNIWLYNIKEDPLEEHELSDSQPEVAKKLLKRLAEYNSVAVPVHFPPYSHKADPVFHGGVWGPWE